MPMFYFNVEGEKLHWTDLVGKPCTDIDAARLEAKNIAGEMVTASLMAGRAPADAVIEVDDEHLRPVFEMRLDHVAA